MSSIKIQLVKLSINDKSPNGDISSNEQALPCVRRFIILIVMTVIALENTKKID